MDFANIFAQLEFSDIVSLFSLALSSFALWFTYRRDRRESNQSIVDEKHYKDKFELDVYKEIYVNFLIKAIPQARIKLHYNGSQITEVDDLIDELTNLRHMSLYFKFHDKNFYDNLTNLQKNIEDKLVNISTKSNISDDENHIFFNDLNNDIGTLYKLISEKYSQY